MSYTLACNTDIFAAIGPVAGIQLNPCRSAAPDVGHAHSRHRRSPGALRRRAGFQRHQWPLRGSGECVLAQRRSVRRPGRHDRWSGHHVDRRMRRQPQRHAHHDRPGRPRMARRSRPGRCGSSSPPLRASITPLVQLLEKCNIGGMPDTHVVTNQVPPLENYNPATSPVLVEALIREGGQWGLDEVNELGALSASHEAAALGRARRPQPAHPAHPRPLPATASTRSSTTRPTTS